MQVNCKLIAEEIKADCANRLSKLQKKPWLLIVQVAGDAASDAYTKGKKKDCAEIGLHCVHKLLPNDASVKDVHDVIEEGNVDMDCIGIILQLPLPAHLQPYQDYLLDSIWRNKDVDGFNEKSPFDPCTPAGIIHIIKRWLNVKDLSDITVLVVGRGKLVGAPIYKLLNRENATIMQANSRTSKDTLAMLCGVADVIVTATGKPNTLTDYHLNEKVRWISPLIVDAGITRGADGKLCGDVDKSLYEDYALPITPVPGGVGLLTRAMLMKNCVDAACKKWSK